MQRTFSSAWWGLCGAVLIHAVAGSASAASPPEPDPGSPAEQQGEEEPYEVDFEADRVDVDGEMRRLRLRGDVAVRVERYRLTSEDLELYRGPRGVVVDGDGRVAFCPCPEPPVTIGFSKATVAPPTDVVIEDPTLRVAGVPILWLPYLWLRSPDRLGLLPPRLAWRAEDGLFAGAGVHVPFGPKQHRKTLDLEAGGYFRGGAELRARLASEQSTAAVRWDYLEDQLLALDARGAHDQNRATSLAWRVDAIRGERGRRATLSLEEAARRYDRAEIGVVRASGASLIGVGLRADAARASELGHSGALGPKAHLGFASALGEVGTFDVSAAAHSMEHPDLPAVSLMRGQGELALDARPGPLAWNLAANQRGFFSTQADGAQGVAAELGGQTRLGLPLVRAYGSHTLHWIEPFTQARVGTAVRDAGFAVDPSLDDGAFVSAVGGIETALGDRSRRRAGELSARAGWVGSAEQPQPALLGKLVAEAGSVGAQSDAAWLVDTPRSVFTASRLRLGRLDGLHLGAYVEGRLEVDPSLARWMAPNAWYAPRADWLGDRAWTAGGELGIPWASWLASAVAADVDVANEELLAIRTTLGYRHPCGCLALLGWAGHRVGREGVDAWLTVDLIP